MARMFDITSNAIVWVSPYNGKIVINTIGSQVVIDDDEALQMIAELARALKDAPEIRKQLNKGGS